MGMGQNPASKCLSPTQKSVAAAICRCLSKAFFLKHNYLIFHFLFFCQYNDDHLFHLVLNLKDLKREVKNSLLLLYIGIESPSGYRNKTFFDVFVAKICENENSNMCVGMKRHPIKFFKAKFLVKFSNKKTWK